MGRAQDDKLRFEDNPIHTGVTKDTASTPGYFRLLLPGLAGRYILRWGVGISKHLTNDLADMGWESAKMRFRDSKHIIAGAEELAQEYGVRAQNIKRGDWRERSRILGDLMQEDKAVEVQSRMREHGLKPGRLVEAIESLERKQYRTSMSRNPISPGIMPYSNAWEIFSSDVKSDVSANVINRGYDYALGTSSLFLTGYYANRVVSDIKKVFAETVGYEMDKDPKDVTYRDIWNSKNKMVEEVRGNFIRKNAWRVGSDLVLFGGALAHLPRLGFLKKYPISDLGVGVKGAQLIGQILNKQTTVFVDLVQLIDTKMNPLKGMGAPIEVADIFDLYQKYTLEHDPKATFRDAVNGQNHDGRDWEKSQTIFQRAADLMNQTYKYKHVVRENVPSPDEKANFTLPKLLYLLGHDLIDTYKPEETLAYIEVANRYGIPAVRQAQRALERGIPVDQALVNYPVELQENIQQLREASDEHPESTKPLSSASRTSQSPKEDAGKAEDMPDTTVHSAADMMRLKEPHVGVHYGAT